MNTLLLIVVAAVFIVGGGFVLTLIVGPFIRGRYQPPDDRRIENRHKFRHSTNDTRH